MQHTVRIEDLIEILNENLTEHQAIFDQAVENYQKAALERLHQHIADVRDNPLHQITIKLPIPEDHSEDYKRIIRMLNLALEAGQEKIVLEDHEAAMYVQDDWNWRRAWVENTVSYVS